jgi:uncharacterized damage-inducible protein DinB
MVNQTPWVERKFNFDFPLGLYPVILERLWGTIPRIVEIVRGKSDSELSNKPSGKWSAKELIGHLYELDGLWDQRITDFLAGQETLSAADMSNQKTHQAGYNERTVAELLTLFTGRRFRLLERVKDLTEEQAGLVALHPRLQKPMRLVDSLYFAAEHDDHELTKMNTLLGRLRL